MLYSHKIRLCRDILGKQIVLITELAPILGWCSPNQRQLVTSVRVCLSSTPGRKYDLDLGAREAR